MSRAALAILSTQNLLHNLKILASKAPNSKMIAMVKANAYGHGLRSVSQRLDGRVASLGVASVDEAVALRKAGVKSSITLMEGAFEAEDLLIASCQGFDVVFHDPIQIQWLNQTSLPNPLKAWLKIDTGMGRLGFLPGSDAEQAYQDLISSPGIQKPPGILSHFACADEKSHALNLVQEKAFLEFTKDKPGPKSFCNSAALFNMPQHHHDVIRPGLALYGISPFPDTTGPELGLKPVMTLQTRLIAVKHLKKGSSIGYGARFTCPEDMPLGIIAMGYGDGYPRTARDGTPMLIHGKICPLVGRVSMDMASMDLRNVPEARVGDLVILWGEGLPVETVAQHTACSPYDLLTSTQTRVKFYWTHM